MKKAIFIIFLLSISATVYAKDAYQSKDLQELRVLAIINVAAVVDAGGEVIAGDCEKALIFCCPGHVAVPVGTSGFTNGIIVPDAGRNAVTIAFPSDGATITDSNVIIKGAVDTTVAVNSVRVLVTTPTNTVGTSYVAQVNGKYFAAQVQLAAGINTVKATVMYQNGTQNETSVTVTDSNQQAMVKLTASPNVGIPTLKLNSLTTLDVGFAAVSLLTNPVASYAWDFNGDGTVDLTCGSLSVVTASFQQPGLYLPTVTVTDTAGNTYTATVIVNVLDKVQMGDFFTQKWNAMMSAFAAGDISGAISYYAGESKIIFTDQLTALLPYRTQVKADVVSFSLVKMIAADVAECELRSVKDGITYSFQVLYVRDDNGNWGIHSY